MAAPRPIFLLPHPDYDARLAPFADVLVAAGFRLDEPERPYQYPGVAGEWDSPERWTYRVSLTLAGERSRLLGSLCRITTKRVEWILSALQLDAPDDLTWLLGRSTSLVDAQQRAAQLVKAHTYASSL
ncbi:hypothetical protein [Hymenobacter negativus]|uniref:Uncharacterized protein n=1 Tax=Hymenobacter negativus TaxID=2795026 RepID=A0ABS3Q9D1_9BACT|nr:hypothetical protein [Hymenobacter negativus]MBO2007583.1 hypothetical protein [Hymenobacter negativus]